MSAPFTTISGARSPPIASSAIVTMPLTGAALPLGDRSSSRRFGRHHFPAVVIAAGRAQMMRPLQLAAIRALAVSRDRQGVVRAPHVAARRRGLFLRDGHRRLVGCCKVNADT